VSVRLGRAVPRKELLSQSDAADTAKRSAATASTTSQWKFLCIEGNISDTYLQLDGKGIVTTNVISLETSV